MIHWKLKLVHLAVVGAVVLAAAAGYADSIASVLGCSW
jgi:hypothetical protein